MPEPDLCKASEILDGLELDTDFKMVLPDDEINEVEAENEGDDLI